MISSIRVIEFTTLSLSEYFGARKSMETYIIHILKHKTSQKGPALIVIKESEYKALTAYIKKYRLLVVNGNLPSCLVFPTINPASRECCSNITYAKVNRIIKKSFTKNCGYLQYKLPCSREMPNYSPLGEVKRPLLEKKGGHIGWPLFRHC